MIKKALTLSGGGSKGAYSVGVLKHWIGELKLRFDIISGASTGAMLAPLAALGEIDLAEEIYTSVRTKDILTFRSATEILRSTSLTSTLPLWGLVKKHMTDERIEKLLDLGSSTNPTPRIVLFSTYRLQDGKNVYFHTGPEALKFKTARPRSELFSVRSAQEPHDCLRLAILASANQPALMPTINVPREEKILQYVDGGVSDALPGAVCAALGADTLHAVALWEAPNVRSYPKQKFDRIYTVAAQMLSRMVEDSLDRSYEETQRAFPADRLTLIRPLKQLTSDSNVFDPAEMKRMLQVGYQQARGMKG